MIARLAAALATLFLIAGCGAFVAPPQPTAGDFTDVVGSLVRRNITVTDQVAGDPGCTDSSLYSNAVRYDVRPAGDSGSYSVFVFGWKSQATFDAAKASFDSCVQKHSEASGAPIETVEHLPWRAYGSGWSAALRDAVDAALTEAGGIPAPVNPE